MFRRRRKLYLVFEYVDHTILGETEIIWEVDNIFAQSKNKRLKVQKYIFFHSEELEEHPSGLDEETARRHVFQVSLFSFDFNLN